ncbi:MAG TPA: AsmA-like C-terminal region-containing protein [Sphingomonas sp.]|nr:AsmA-like C-terminal region-containing protein [Sphingomonas sp.]
MRDRIAGWASDRRLRWGAGILGGVAIAIALLVGAFPWGALERMVETKLGDRYGAAVTIGSIERTDLFSFTPTVVIRDVRIPQPRWAGIGDFARIRSARVTFGAFGALVGRFSARAIEIDGLRLALVRDAKGRKNWGGTGSGSLALDRLRLADSRLSYDDAVQDRHVEAAIAADAQGLRLNGKGTIKGNPVSVTARGPAVSSANRWPFDARIDGPALTITAKGTMTRALDTGHMAFDMSARADDLKLVDAVIEAGLFGTQPATLAAHVVRDDPKWSVTKLRGTIGRSDLTGHVIVDKQGDRTRLDGAVAFGSLDFEDLASDAGNAAAIARERAHGLRLVPDTRINLAHVGPTDGRIDFAVRRIVSRRRPSSLAWTRGTLTLDHGVLTADPFTLGLTRGTVEGSVTVDQRDGGAVPIVSVALALKGGTLAALAGGGESPVDARLSGRLRLTGKGSTFREAVGRSDGHIALVATQGALPARLASMLGFDVARGLTTDKDERAALRCTVLRLDLDDGTGTLAPMVIDTTRAQSRGTGTIDFPSEALAIRVTGAPKEKSVLRLPGAILMTGTIRAPEVQTEKGTRSIGNIFKAIGQSISGDQPPRATDADCDALAARALAF